MGKPKMTALAVALRAIEPLSDEEKQTLRDVLRPAPKPRSKPKPERKPTQKRKAEKEATAFSNDGDREYGNIDKLCGSCDQRFGDNVHHLKPTEGYHEFVESTGEAKGASV